MAPIRRRLGFALLGTAVAASRVDLSYLPHVPASQIASAIPWQQDTFLDLDVSNSHLGDEGFAALLVNATNTTQIHLVARQNQITSKGVAKFLQSINHTSLSTIDLGWNHLEPTRTLCKALQQLVASPQCPTTLRLDNCGITPALCRALGHGLMQRSEGRPLHLHFVGNPTLGDAGVAALAAAMASNPKAVATLDVSACGISDEGAASLVQALGNLTHLDLSSNRLTDQGIITLSQALTEDLSIDCLDVSHNKDVGDRGAAAIAEVVERGGVKDLRMRSCHIFADGAAAFGKCLRNFALSEQGQNSVAVDLSGNPIGMLRGKVKSGESKYSASALKSKATATAASYFGMLKKGLKDVGVDMSPLLGESSMSAESDDEEEKSGNVEADDESNTSKERCGIKAFASAFRAEMEDGDISTSPTSKKKLKLALRRCFLDHAASDALAAVLVTAKDDMDLDIVLDIDLNPVLEDDMHSALVRDADYEDLLHEMAERHTDTVELVNDSRRRAMDAAKTAAARRRPEPGPWDMDEDEEEWEVPVGIGDDHVDSDAGYDDDDEDYF